MLLSKLKMSYQLVVVVCLQFSLLNAAPLFLLPFPWPAQMQQDILQRQLMELQALQQLQAQSHLQMVSQQQPLMILLPNDRLNQNINIKQHLKLNNDHQHLTPVQTNLETEDDDLNSIIVDAPEEIQNEESNNRNEALYPQPQRAFFLLPNGRLSIGDIISAIPFLPIEVNVPDTITWIYNNIASGIGSIITIIGGPSQGATQKMQTQEGDLKTLLKRIQTSKQNVVRPIIMMPIIGPTLPIQV